MKTYTLTPYIDEKVVVANRTILSFLTQKDGNENICVKKLKLNVEFCMANWDYKKVSIANAVETFLF